jgi:hypothetical protein
MPICLPYPVVVIVRASSTLQRNKRYQAINALDGDNDSTCWCSEGHTNNITGTVNGIAEHFFLLEFPHRVCPRQLRIQFQAGFVARCGEVWIKSSSPSYDRSGVAEKDGKDLDRTWICVLGEPTRESEHIWDDVHELQSLDLDTKEKTDAMTAMKIIFRNFTDLYGRITIYRLEVWGYDDHSASVATEVTYDE